MLVQRKDICNGKALAEPGQVLSVGIVSGKLQDRDATVRELALPLDIKEKTILQKLSASWVKADFFVPVFTIPKIRQLDPRAENPDQNIL